MLNVIKKIILKRKIIALMKKGDLFHDEIFNQFRNKKDIVLLALDYDINTIQHIDESLLSDKDIALKAIQKNPLNLKYYKNSTIINDENIVLVAIKSNPATIRFASNNIKNNLEIAKQVLIKDSECLEYFSQEVRNNKEIVDLALSKFYHNKTYKFIGEKFKDDKELALKEMVHHGEMFEFVSEILKSDKDVLLASLQSSNGTSILFAKESIKNDVETIKQALSYASYSNINIFKELNHLVKDNKEIALLAITKKPESYLYVSENLKHDIDIINTAIKLEGKLFEHLPKIFQTKREIVVAALKEYSLAIEFMSDQFKKDVELAKLIVTSNYDKTLYFLSDEIKDNKEIVLLAIKNHASQLEFASVRLKKDYDLVSQAISQSGVTYRFIDESLKSDPYLIRRAIECSTGLAINYIDSKYLENPEIKDFVIAYKSRYNIYK